MQEALEILRQPTFAWKEGQFDNTLPSINLEKYCKTLENLNDSTIYLYHAILKQVMYSYMPEKLFS